MKKILYLIVVFIFCSCKQETKDKRVNITTKEEKEKGVLKYNFYRQNGDLDKTLEYINLCGKNYLNQGWYFKNNTDTIFERSHYYKIFVEKKTLKTMETTKITMFYKPLLQNTVSGILINKNIDVDYCNLNMVKLDTIYFVDNRLEFYQGFKNKGKTNIGGYILEMSKKSIKKENKNQFNERRVYFNISFEVR